MDFLMGLPLYATKKTSIWVIGDRLTRFAHLFLIQDTCDVERLTQLYVKEIGPLHGIPAYIMSYRDQRFEGHFWQAF